MTPKERMLTALDGGVPDRLPITIHQWQSYHLAQQMQGMTALQAFQATGLDASITPSGLLSLKASGRWTVTNEEFRSEQGQPRTRTRVDTPDGPLVTVRERSDGTVYTIEHLIKSEADAQAFLAHWPGMTLDKDRLSACYDETGDAGIVRGFTEHAHQAGVWQDFCELVGTAKAILWALDDPGFVHHFLETLTQKRVAFVHEQMPGAKLDLVEHGGGAASSSVISPTMFDEFCVPYDLRVHEALHSVGLKVVYHTCGGMMAILDRIPANGCDVAETLSPPGVGGDIATREDRLRVKDVLGGKVALIGGIDQGRLEEPVDPDSIGQEVVECFQTFGAGGGYICSASDHFFHAPPENLRALAEAARQCIY